MERDILPSASHGYFRFRLLLPFPGFPFCKQCVLENYNIITFFVALVSLSTRPNVKLSSNITCEKQTSHVENNYNSNGHRTLKNFFLGLPEKQKHIVTQRNCSEFLIFIYFQFRSDFARSGAGPRGRPRVSGVRLVRKRPERLLSGSRPLPHV